MPSIVVRVEANEIAVEDSLENLIPHRQDAIDFATWKWSMQEEANFYVLSCRPDCFTQQGRKEHQMVVMYPDNVVILYIIGNRLCEKLVRGLVCLPSFFVESDFTRVVVKQWPEDRVCFVDD